MFAQFLLEDIGPDTSRPPGSTSRWADYQTGLYHHDGRAKRSVVQGFRLPFFVEQVREPSGALHTVAFGQVRPGSRPQRVLIQRRLGPGRWIVESSLRLLRAGLRAPACNEFPTGPDGFFQRRLPVRGGGTYRFAWTDGDRLVRFSQEVTVGAPRLLVGGLGAVVRGPG